MPLPWRSHLRFTRKWLALLLITFAWRKVMPKRLKDEWQLTISRRTFVVNGGAKGGRDAA